MRMRARRDVHEGTTRRTISSSSTGSSATPPARRRPRSRSATRTRLPRRPSPSRSRSCSRQIRPAGAAAGIHVSPPPPPSGLAAKTNELCRGGRLAPAALRLRARDRDRELASRSGSGERGTTRLERTIRGYPERNTVAVAQSVEPLVVVQVVVGSSPIRHLRSARRARLRRGRRALSCAPDTRPPPLRRAPPRLKASSRNSGAQMAPGGVEPPRAASKAAALSAELRGPRAA
jgi:hypothetical protein